MHEALKRHPDRVERWTLTGYPENAALRASPTSYPDSLKAGLPTAGQPPPLGTTGLHHVAILYPTRADLADALRRLLVAGFRLDGAADHGVSEAICLRDPDGNGVELYWDKPKEQWRRGADGGLVMFTHPLDLDALVSESGRIHSGYAIRRTTRPTVERGPA
jgi:catechol-2,3-dioxygenase